MIFLCTEDDPHSKYVSYLHALPSTLFYFITSTLDSQLKRTCGTCLAHWCDSNVLLLYRFCCCTAVLKGKSFISTEIFLLCSNHSTHIYSRWTHTETTICNTLMVRMKRRQRLQAFAFKHGKCARSTSICQLYAVFYSYIMRFYQKWWFVFIHALLSLFRLVSASRFKLTEWFSIRN